MTWRDYLSPSADAAAARWSLPCEEMFTFFAGAYPHDLLAVVTSKTLTNAQLTYAAEGLGNVIFDNDEKFRNNVKKVLVDLASNHDSAMVREGALYGLSHMGAECRLLLVNLATHDRSESIRSIAREMLESGL